jgi:hypothetical protein
LWLPGESHFSHCNNLLLHQKISKIWKPIGQFQKMIWTFHKVLLLLDFYSKIN